MARARATASATQSRIGASFVWHIRQMSPRCTSCSISTVPASSTTRTVPGDGDLERLVVGAVLLGGLGHQADVGRRAHGRRVERAVALAVLDRLRVDRGVGVVGDHELGVLLLAGGVPHLPGGADRGRHRRVDDHVARDVEVGDAAVGVDHGQRRARRRTPRRSRRGSPPRVGSGSRSSALSSAPRPSFGLTPAAASVVAVALEHRREEGAHGVAEDDRVRDLHHRRLQVDREEDALGARPRRSARAGRRRARRARITDAVEHLAGEHRQSVPQDGHRPVASPVLDPDRRRRRSTVTERSVERKSPSVIVETCERESGDHAPIECGWVRA